MTAGFHFQYTVPCWTLIQHHYTNFPLGSLSQDWEQLPTSSLCCCFVFACFSAQEADSLPYDFSNKPLNRLLACQKPVLGLLKTKQRARSPRFQVWPWTLRGLWGLTEKQLGSPKLNPTGNKNVSILPESSPFQKLVGNTYRCQQSLAQRPLPGTRQYQKEIHSAN